MTCPPRRPPALSGVDLHLGYRGDLVVHGAAVELRRGRVTALVGPNGSGKSTLLRAVARLHVPTRGQVSMQDGTDALALSSREFARRVTLLAQSRPVPTGISVSDVVGFGRHPYRGRLPRRRSGRSRCRRPRDERHGHRRPAGPPR